jgi:hypothetical protein
MVQKTLIHGKYYQIEYLNCKQNVINYGVVFKWIKNIGITII